MRHLRRLIHCLALGAFSGAAVAPMQLLLWPEVRPALMTCALAFLAWASWGALWFGVLGFLVVEVVALSAPFLAAQRGISIGLWRWLAFVHGAVLASIAWANQERTAQLLLREHRDGLKTIAIVTSLFAIVTLLMVVRRAPRRRPVVWLGGASLAVLVALWAVWATSPRIQTGEGAEPPLRFATNRRLLLVSWEGADLPWLLPAMERGDMPFLRSHRDSGAWGQVTAVRPFSRSTALATLATGCNAAVHGVFGRRAYRLPWLSQTPLTLPLAGPWPTPHVLPWRAWERAVAPPPRRATLWEILERAGRPVGLAGWPGVPRATWTIPPPLAAEAMPFDNLDRELRAAIEPSLAEQPSLAGPTRDAIAVAAQVMAATALRQARQPVDCLFVNTDLVRRLRPMWTRTEGEAGEEEVLRNAARLLDEQLRELWLMAGGDDCLLVVVSPYGMAPPKPWRRLLNAVARRQARAVSSDNSPEGFVLFSGPGVRKAVRLHFARLTDIAATCLYLLELPVARDMAGKVLLDAVDDEYAAHVPLRLIPSYPPGDYLRRVGPL